MTNDSHSKPTGSRLTGISIENFKGVGDRIDVPLKSVTLLFGANSAGKSTIIHAIEYAREILERRNYNLDKTSTGSEMPDLGVFSTFVHNHEIHRPIHLGFDLDLAGMTLPRLWNVPAFGSAIEDTFCSPGFYYGDVETARIEFTITWSELLQRTCVTRFATHINGGLFTEIQYTPGSKYPALSVESRHPIFTNRPDLLHILWNYRDGDEEKYAGIGPFEQSLSILIEEYGMLGLRSTERGGTTLLVLDWESDALPRLDRSLRIVSGVNGGDGDREGFLYECNKFLSTLISEVALGPAAVLRDLLIKTRHIGPLRNVPERSHQRIVSKPSNNGQWIDGTAAWNRILENEPTLLAETQQWLSDCEKLNIGYRLESLQFREHTDVQIKEIDVLLNRLLYDADVQVTAGLVSELLKRPPLMTRLSLFDISKQIYVEPRDIGVGVSQLIPVVIALLDRHGGVTAVEQPELHLHPAIQVSLGDLLIHCIQNSSRVLLIETHSEHLMLRLLRRIRETTDNELPFGHPGMTPEQLSVLYVASENGQSKVTELPVDQTGEFCNRWPKGFFRERESELF